MIGMEYLLIGLALIVLFLIYYIFTRESQSSRQIHAIASAVEELRRDLYALEKKMDRHILDTPVMPSGINEEELADELERGLQNFSVPLSNTLGEIESGFEAHKEQMEKRMHLLEEAVRNLSLPSSVSGMDDEKIISLYKQGVDIATISKELHLSKPEVEFVLKINQIK